MEKSLGRGAEETSYVFIQHSRAMWKSQARRGKENLDGAALFDVSYNIAE